MEDTRICICGCGEIFKCKNISKRKYITGHALKGKTYEEVYGKEKAKQIKEIISKKNKEKIVSQETRIKQSNVKKGQHKGLKYEEIYGKEKALEMKKIRSKLRKGKSNIEIYGKEKALEMKKINFEKHKGKKYGTLIERFGKEKALEMKEKKSKLRKGKTIEQVFGKKKAQIIKEKLSKSKTKWTKEQIEIAFKIVPNIKRTEWNNFVNLRLLPSPNVIRKHFNTFKNLEQITGKHFLPNKKRKKFVGNNEKFILDNIEKEKGIKLERNFGVKTNIGRFYIDGYDLINNQPYEVDESHHRYQKVLDDIREEAIIPILNCKSFIRIPEQQYMRNINQTMVDDF